MKPFSTPVLSKRTYRELKLLKHIQHENVCDSKRLNNTTSLETLTFDPLNCTVLSNRSSACAMCSYLLKRICECEISQDFYLNPSERFWDPFISYFVTELLGTDLHRLLTSRPLEKQFVQYFLYQILVSLISSPRCRGCSLAYMLTLGIRLLAWVKIRPLCRSCAS